MKQVNVLFLYMVNGTGHQKAAGAIIDALKDVNPFIRGKSIAYGETYFPAFTNTINRFYIWFIKKFPGAWDYIYDNQRIYKLLNGPREMILYFGRHKIVKTISRTDADLIVCTQAVAASMVAGLKKRGNLNKKLAAVITDYDVHRYWIHSEIDCYLVGHQTVKKKLIQAGINAAKIHVTGIPIHPNFTHPAEKNFLKRRFQFSSDKKNVLIMGGSLGMGPIEKLVNAIDKHKKKYRLVVATGRNKKLFKTLLKKKSKHIYPVPYLKDPSKIMKGVDLVISKPGGISCAEILALKKPMLLIKSIRGQENRNGRFLSMRGIAKQAENEEQVINLLNEFDLKWEKGGRSKALVEKNAFPLSSYNAARQILRLL